MEMPDKNLSFGKSMLILLFLLGSIFLGVVLWGLDAQIPIIITTIFAAGLAISNGSKWSDLESSILESLGTVGQAILVLLVIGMMLGTWLHSGVVPTMIYYGAKLISPAIFLPTACFLCSISSLSTGDSWGTAGTLGVAIMGIGIGFGVPPAIVAGAVVSGSYFGDKMSPLSDTTLLASAVTKVNLFEHIKYMLYTTIPSLAIALVAYFFIGLRYSKNVDLAELNLMLSSLKEAVNINPILLTAPLFVIVMIIKKVQPLPALMGGTLLGSVFAMIFQKASLMEVFEAMHYGVESDTGNEVIDLLVSGGGLDYVMWTISLIYCAMALGGVLKGSGALETIVGKIVSRVNTTGGLIAATAVTSIFLNVATADQYLAILFSGEMYGDEYKRRGIAAKVLSRTLEESGTLTSALIPWNTCGAFMMGVLGVSPFIYLPFAIFNWVSPIVGIVFGYLNIKIARIDDEIETEADAV
jgi:NhaC family Na+:H+ antiporter